jgi:probable rRNA maturation factor
MGNRVLAAYTIHIQVDSRYQRKVNPRPLRTAARAALVHQAASPGDVGLRLTGDAILRKLNREHLGHDYATDVLSFPSTELDPETGRRYFGDLILSVPRAAAQARAGGHPLRAELQLLVVHGVLHLLGHDHANAREKQRMWAAQAKILAHLKAPITGPAD